MLVRKFLCCMPLVWGAIATGLVFGTADSVIGSLGWKMVIQDQYPGWLVDFFRKMDTQSCVFVCSTVVYLLAMDHFLLTYGAFTANRLIVGIWLLINSTLFILTLFTGFLSGWAFLRLVVVGYCIIVVRSYYENLIATPSEDEATVAYSRVDEHI